MVSCVYVDKLSYDEEAKQYSWVSEQVTPEIEKDVAVNEYAVVSEMARQPGLVAFYGELAGELRAEVQRKEQEVERVKLHLQSLRRTEMDAENKRATKDALEEYVIQRVEYQTAVAAVGMSRLYSNRAQSWYRAIEQKKDLLVAMTYRQNAEMKAL